jgi:HAD superfamily hydrolase (TIGR01484 family)
MSGTEIPLTHPVELFVVDLDNTLNPRAGRPLNLTMLAEVQALSARSSKDRTVPPLALITGRPQPYLEAMQQAVASAVPGVFEFGYGLFDLITGRLAVNPAWNPELERVRGDLLKRCDEEFMKPGRGRLQKGKKTAVTIVPLTPDTVESLHYPSFKVSREFTDSFMLHTGPTTIDFVPQNIHKGIGLQWIAEVQQVRTSRVAVMGDSTTDLPMFREAGVAFAPMNAAPAVKAEAHIVTRGGVTAGVIEAYNKIIDHNASM